MRVLSLTQPWAQAVRDLKKQWETRSWSTSYRGELGIHAAKGFPGWAKEFAEDNGYPAFGKLPLGRIICVCDLTDCQPTEKVSANVLKEQREFMATQGVHVVSQWEEEFIWGDYSPGRFAFRLENIRPLTEPILCSGALGLWMTTLELHSAIAAQVPARF